MTTEQCGIFATLIPVFLVATYLTGNPKFGSDGRWSRIVECVVLVLCVGFTAAGEYSALIGVSSGGSTRLEGVVMTEAAMVSFGTLVANGVIHYVVAAVVDYKASRVQRHETQESHDPEPHQQVGHDAPTTAR